MMADGGERGGGESEVDEFLMSICSILALCTRVSVPTAGQLLCSLSLWSLDGVAGTEDLPVAMSLWNMENYTHSPSSSSQVHL